MAAYSSGGGEKLFLLQPRDQGEWNHFDIMNMLVGRHNDSPPVLTLPDNKLSCRYNDNDNPLAFMLSII